MLVAAAAATLLLGLPGTAAADREVCCWKVEVKASGNSLTNWGPKDPNKPASGIERWTGEWTGRTVIGYYHDTGGDSDFTRCPRIGPCAPSVGTYSVMEDSDMGGGASACSNAVDSGPGRRPIRSNLQLNLSPRSRPPTLGILAGFGIETTADDASECWSQLASHSVYEQECRTPADFCAAQVFDLFEQTVAAPSRSRFRDAGRRIATSGVRIYVPKRRKRFSNSFAWRFDHEPFESSPFGPRHETAGAAATSVRFVPFPAGTRADPGVYWRREVRALRRQAN